MIVAFWVELPDVPMTVIVAGPVAAVELAVRVRILVVVVLAGLNAAVAPAGRPEADKATALSKPPVNVTVTMLVLLAPCATLMALGTAATANPVETGPARVIANTTTSRVFGNVTLCTALLVLSGNE